jgi:hypothetical protein
MPVVANIDGISIEFYPSEHPPPHFHARYAEYIAQIDIRSCRVIRGSLPPAQWRKVAAWAEPRKDRLMAAWQAVEERRKPGRIHD